MTDGVYTENGRQLDAAGAPTSDGTFRVENQGWQGIWAGTFPSTITLTLGGTTTPPVATPGGSAVEWTTSATVTTDAGHGFVLSVHRQNAGATMLSGANTLPDKAAWTSTTPNAVPYSGTGLAFRMTEAGSAGMFNAAWWGNDASPLFAGFPATDQTIASRASSVTNQPAQLGYRLAVPSAQASGTYTGVIVLTATTQV